MAATFAFIKRGKFKVERGTESDVDRYSHLSFNGGKYQIPDDHLQEFIYHYTRDVSAMELVFYIEQRNDTFPLFIDFDFVDARVISDRFVVACVTCVQSCLGELYPNLKETRAQNFRAFVCRAPVKQLSQSTSSNDTAPVTLCKSGVHVHFPGVVVTAQIALDIRALAMERLRLNVSSRSDEQQNPWADAYDSAVYQHSGLRPIGSDKARVCVECKGKRSRGCDACHGGVFGEQRPYAPCVMLDGAGAVLARFVHFSRIVCPVQRFVFLYNAMCQTTIRIATGAPITPGYSRPIGMPSSAVGKAPRKRKALPTAAAVDTTSPSSPIRDGKFVDQRSEADVYETIERLCRSIHPLYATIDIASVERMPRGKTLTYRARARKGAIGSSYCQNKAAVVKEDHSANTIYFEIAVCGVSQRCWSNKCYNGVMCRDFASRRRALTIGDRERLFPGDAAGAVPNHPVTCPVATRG